MNGKELKVIYYEWMVEINEFIWCERLYIYAFYNKNTAPYKQSIYQTISKTRHIEHNYSIAEQTIKRTHNTHHEKLINVNAVYVIQCVYIYEEVSFVYMRPIQIMWPPWLQKRTDGWVLSLKHPVMQTQYDTHTRNHHSQNPSGCGDGLLLHSVCANVFATTQEWVHLLSPEIFFGDVLKRFNLIYSFNLQNWVRKDKNKS